MNDFQIKIIIDLFNNWDVHGHRNSDITYIKSLVLDDYSYTDITEFYTDYILKREKKLEKISELELEIENLKND